MVHDHPSGASDEEAAEGASRVGQIGGGIAHLEEITQRMGQLDEALSSLATAVRSLTPRGG